MIKKIYYFSLILLFFSFPFGKRIIFFDEYSYFTGQFHYYPTIFISLSLFLYFIYLFFTILNLIKKKQNLNLSFNYLWLIFFLILFLLLFKVSFPLLHFYQIIFIILAHSIFLFPKNFDIKHKNLALKAFLHSMFLVSIIGIFQFIFQKSIGFSFLGEISLSPDILGLAKIKFPNFTLLRSYGLFPHPNIFAFFLSIAIYLSFKFKQRFYLFIYFISLILTFSKSIILFWLIFLFFYLKNKKKYHKLFLILLILVLIFTYPSFNLSFFSRLDNFKEAFYIFLNNPYFLGLKHYLFFLPETKDFIIKPWDNLVLHNTYFLVLIELGLFLGGTYFYLFYQKLKKHSFLLLLILWVALFDHYLWSYFPVYLFITNLLFLLEKNNNNQDFQI
jgi:hypothetical protein